MNKKKKKKKLVTNFLDNNFKKRKCFINSEIQTKSFKASGQKDKEN